MYIVNVNNVYYVLSVYESQACLLYKCLHIKLDLQPQDNHLDIINNHYQDSVMLKMCEEDDYDMMMMMMD